MADNSCVKRLQKEYRALCKEPVFHVVARPSPNDILEWHYVLEGSGGTPFAGGYYYGKIKFPPEYPYKPPGISSSRKLESYVVCIKMDSSPTTGSVNTTTAEKQRLAKSSLAFNCKNATFRKMFPEYMKKYNQQQLSSERVSLDMSNDETSRPDYFVEKRADGLKDVRRNKRQPFPTWMVLLLFSIVGVVMALPLLQL